jgi:glycerate 2-kinase
MPTSSAGSSGNDAAARMRARARDIFLHALGESSIAKAFARHVSCDKGVLRVADDLFDLSAYRQVFVVSFGKAGHAMADALSQAVGPRLGGIVVDVTEPPQQLPNFRYYKGGHPTPTADSLKAGRAILRALKRTGEGDLVIFMLSGGGSALVEVPIDDEISLPDLAATYSALVRSGAPIAEINAIRKHLSALKGGRMAQAAEGAQQVSIMVSDVPDHALDALASGPTMPDSTTAGDCYAVAKKHQLLPQFPSVVRELFEKQALEETPKSVDAVFAGSRWWPVLSNSSARKAAAEQATLAGYAVEVDNSCDDWDYAAAADYLLDRVRKLHGGVSRVCLISGGEVTVKVGAEAGTGGRNQQFALYCAGKIAGENVAVLSAGTDGIDGNSTAAGAVADGTTIERALSLQLDAASALQRFDAYNFFQPLGDTIVTGPTGTNVRDLRILLAG